MSTVLSTNERIAAIAAITAGLIAALSVFIGNGNASTPQPAKQVPVAQHPAH